VQVNDVIVDVKSLDEQVCFVSPWAVTAWKCRSHVVWLSWSLCFA
jgi:hypothetical protein